MQNVLCLVCTPSKRNINKTTDMCNWRVFFGWVSASQLACPSEEKTTGICKTASRINAMKNNIVNYGNSAPKCTCAEQNFQGPQFQVSGCAQPIEEQLKMRLNLLLA